MTLTTELCTFASNLNTGGSSAGIFLLIHLPVDYSVKTFGLISDREMVCGIAHTEAEKVRLIFDPVKVRKLAFNSLYSIFNRLCVISFENDAKLISAVSRDEVIASNRFAQKTDGINEGNIAFKVAKAIIYGFKIVNIKQNRGERPFIGRGIDSALHIAVKRLPVERSGQIILVHIAVLDICKKNQSRKGYAEQSERKPEY
jgi:hypothetical protein